MRAAEATAVPAGKALAVDRGRFAAAVTAAIEQHPLITVHRQEVTALPDPSKHPVVLAAGPQSRLKKLEIEGLEQAQLMARLPPKGDQTP